MVERFNWLLVKSKTIHAAIAQRHTAPLESVRPCWSLEGFSYQMFLPSETGMLAVRLRVELEFELFKHKPNDFAKE